ncbi:hypothetical protein, partial [Nostoc sp. ChiSLP03a]|uniref:hypothetical protein n=1 Tax=Nostoc sp. ChiSLP03a TaxID=3075380 RepID=UPI002AD2A994
QARLLGSLFAGGHNYKVWASVSQRFYWSFHQGLLPVYRLTALAVAITVLEPFSGFVVLLLSYFEGNQPLNRPHRSRTSGDCPP